MIKHTTFVMDSEGVSVSRCTYDSEEINVHRNNLTVVSHYLWMENPSVYGSVKVFMDTLSDGREITEEEYNEFVENNLRKIFQSKN